MVQWQKDKEKKSTTLAVWGNNVGEGEADSNARKERMKLVTNVIFLLNVTKVGDRTCAHTSILVTVDIPEGITSIGDYSFAYCKSLKDIKFSTTVESIGQQAFTGCESLVNINLLNTRINRIASKAFGDCKKLKSMKIPDALEMSGFGRFVFQNCSELVPTKINVSDTGNDVTGEVIAYLHKVRTRILGHWPH